ncbi:hypothetical protein N0M98_31635 [Paenibacillus doosanensis]|uniref:Uncharacterized protein n=1 Tax=Paenibacillus konkukensis TaxID=2020716 RepID=A0ABY4RPY4_9BACL|nr:MULTISPECIES: hypothetical protein [Paenibacillus]MCS7464650.1 hypothetical protein [Paenibacillus doosanensis]UQZ84050.1 hypothetical protein SK3146_03282 [Paenibacillus konkukensis]
MSRIRAKRAEIILYGLLMACIPLVLYLELHGEIVLGIVVVCVMFALSMGLLRASEAGEDRPERKGRKARNMRSAGG